MKKQTSRIIFWTIGTIILSLLLLALQLSPFNLQFFWRKLQHLNQAETTHIFPLCLLAVFGTVFVSLYRHKLREIKILIMDK